MSVRARIGLTAGVAVAVGALAGPAAGAPSVGAPSGGATGGSSIASGEVDAVRLLQRAVRAARSASYTGVQHLTLFTGDRSVSAVADVVHVPGMGSVVRLRDTPLTEGRQMLEPDTDAASYAAPTDEDVRLLEQQYDLSVDGRAHADGRVADVVVVRRPEGSLAARLWLDVATGLLLRREILDPEERLVRSSSFVDLRVSREPMIVADAPVAEAMPQPWQDRVDVVAERSRLTGMGFTVPDELPGGFVLYDARLGASHGDEVLHLCYSDGLTSLSLFQQRGRLDSDGLDGWQRTRVGRSTVWVAEGLPSRLTWSARGTVYTVLADVPSSMVEEAVRALPHRQSRPGVLARLGHGLARIGSWLNPFG